MEQPEQRELVYCHQCENEWNRDEHGLTCPACQSDFTEIIEHPDRRVGGGSESSPAQNMSANQPHQNHEFYAPDPEEADVDDLRWDEVGPGRYRVRARVNTTLSPGSGPQSPQQGGLGGGLMGILGGVIQNIMQPPQQQQGQPRQGQESGRPNTQPRSASTPGTPIGAQQFSGPGGGTFIHSGQGPGFSWTMQTSSNVAFPGAPFDPFPQTRTFHVQQGSQTPPDHIHAMMQQIMMNITGASPHAMGPPPHGAPMVFSPIWGPNQAAGNVHGSPMDHHPLMGMFNFFGPHGGQLGDAVFSQEALDRVITQLMEQNQSGSAPGPASEAAIRSLPTKKITDNDISDSGKAECSICMDEVPFGKTVTVLPCSHWFHKECIDIWLHEHDTCPHCRRGIMPKEDENGAAAARSPSQEPRHDMNSPQFTRPTASGASPFPTSPSAPERSSTSVPGTPGRGPRPGTDNRSNSGSGGGMFNRMREAFGRSTSSNDQNAESGNDGRGSRT